MGKKIIVNPVQTNIKQDKIDIRLAGEDGTRVVIIKNGLTVADLEWKAAKDLGIALCVQAKRAENKHWYLCQKRLGKEIPVKEAFGIPLLRDERELEQL